MYRRLLISLLILNCLVTSGQEARYSSELTRKLDIKSQTIGDLGLHQIVREYDQDGRLTNVGLDVLSAEVSEMLPREISSFITRYFLELLCWDETSLQQKMNDDKVFFTKGYPYDILKLGSDCDFNLICKDNKNYAATWSRDGKDVLSFSFPINYELILGMPQSEIELQLEEDFRQTDTPERSEEEDEMEKIEDGIYRTMPAANYQIPSLVNCRYYSNDSQRGFVPVFTSDHPRESAANLFLMAMDCDFPINIKQRIYGFKTIEYQITTSQWVAYCQRHGLTTYFAVEREDVDSIMALVIGESKDLAYNHMLSIAIPKSFTKGKGVAFKAKLNAYIPTHNVSELYQQAELK